MLKAIGWVALGVVVMTAGFLYEYESLDPCEWMTQEMTQYAGLSGVTGLGDTAGVVMDTGECFTRWMDLRVKGAEQ